MIWPDAVDHPPVMRRPWALALTWVLVSAVLWARHPGAWPLARGLPDPLAAGALAGVVIADIYLVAGLPRRWQAVAVWLQLAALLAVFFVSFDLSFPFIRRKLWILFSIGLVNTIVISAASILAASGLALAGALMRLSGDGLAEGLVGFYTSFFRGVPLLMQIYILYLGLPQLGIVIDAVPSGIIALSLCYGAYMTEIFRAGIEAVPKGQWEAARALGFTHGQTLSRVILPQALPVIIPPTGNQFISMLKDSSLVSVIGVWELMYLARTEGQTEFRHIEMMLTASLIYWAFSGLLEIAQAAIERRLGRAHGR
jgi:polar amino acid transport system permease protein